jgi:hypothetical protein
LSLPNFWYYYGRDVPPRLCLLVNLRERRFEVLDSVRLISDKSLDQKVNLLVGTIKTLWEQYYANSSVKLATWDIQDIKPPKQGSK